MEHMYRVVVNGNISDKGKIVILLRIAMALLRLISIFSSTWTPKLNEYDTVRLNFMGEMD